MAARVFYKHGMTDTQLLNGLLQMNFISNELLYSAGVPGSSPGWQQECLICNNNSTKLFSPIQIKIPTPCRHWDKKNYLIY